ncbi:hypothetical protein SBA6_90032 [Candidatus Sulfopaludibacter sp. SbA6]|nr:hypothetical protein SBA6_90032 [Candidatus Sulfopaludibacter sp. SbA6]
MRIRPRRSPPPPKSKPSTRSTTTPRCSPPRTATLIAWKRSIWAAPRPNSASSFNSPWGRPDHQNPLPVRLPLFFLPPSLSGTVRYFSKSDLLHFLWHFTTGDVTLDIPRPPLQVQFNRENPGGHGSCRRSIRVCHITKLTGELTS